MKILQDLQSTQPEAIRRIQSARETGRLHHAHIIASPDAKASFELAHAVALDLLAPEAERGDRESPSHRKMSGGNHPDFIHIAPDERNRIRIDAIRAMSSRLALSPSEAAMQVVLIEAADSMNAAAQNALLKTLEEPPGHCCFLMTVRRYRSLLPTVRSRSQKLQLIPTQHTEATSQLREAGIPESIAPTLAALVGPDVERAEQMVEDGALEIYESLQELTRENDIHQTLNLAAELGRSAERTDIALSLLAIELRDRLAQNRLAHVEHLYTNPQGQTDTDILVNTAQALETLRSKAAFNPNRTMNLERIFLELTGQL